MSETAFLDVTVLPWRPSARVMKPEERRESYRTLWRAAQHIRDVNADRRVRVRWTWA
ncbi:hypothetical protein SAMN05216199_3944 [Pedococcus cremeus]|uniref:Uncharacterized protein n=1 Tax=Pedococcus cremeus TaxID=587636 RepID=A0A1H9XJQ5_9MICO|nr:hypothetical protein SAMN05216199_3944 [Pedococcus cremeus]